MNRTIIFNAILLSLLFATIAACTGNETARSRQVLTVSIEPQRFLLEKITGDKWTINTLLAKGTDPESYDPSMSDLMKVQQSQAYFSIGHMNFEDAVLKRLSESNADITIVDSSDGITLLEGTHGQCNHRHSHETDPHVWSSVKNARTIAGNMYKAMLLIDSANKDYYTHNYTALLSELDSLDAHIAHILSPVKGAAFMVWHPSLSYFAHDYGMQQIAMGMDNKEMSADGFRNKIDMARAHNTTVFFIQPEYDSNRSENILRQTQAHAVIINPLAYDWSGEMLRIAEALAPSNDKCQ